MVVHKVTENQLHLDSSGFAPAPPMVTRPSGEKKAQTQVRTKAKLPQLNRKAKFASIQRLTSVAPASRASRLTRLATTVDTRMIIGAQKTMGLTSRNKKLPLVARSARVDPTNIIPG